jgi:hypothetical protein
VRVHRRSSRTRTCAKTASRKRIHRTSLAPDRRDQGLRKTPGSCRSPPSADGREFKFADCADSRPWSAEFAHPESGCWRDPVLTQAAESRGSLSPVECSVWHSSPTCAERVRTPTPSPAAGRAGRRTPTRRCAQARRRACPDLTAAAAAAHNWLV